MFSKQESRNRFLYSAFLVIITTSFLDFLGVQFGFWLYHYEVFPWMPAFVPWDWTLIPVVIISLIEYKPKLSPHLKGTLFAILAAFVGGPLFKHFDFYKEINWSSFYSFPIYYLIFLIGYWASLRNNYQVYWK
ncbi:hypothetical protein HNQ94_000912 [Salirhabdus euzebyi]|uniref:Uncharacterized protein n=1 Tax=Salirhabdus euzebyi TaxID=394506 RepID=A0A841PU05_9BACI|nr:CBO0543 family protein [Salirhabdus euzebyi]MBB6452467.1 hypothetical protein [Salirhabdus euzebyi]